MAGTIDDMKPVRDRVTAPPTFQPSHPLITRWRPATFDDVDSVLPLMQAIDSADHPNYVLTREELEEEFGYSFVDLATDSLIGFTADGVPVALGLVVMPPLQETLVRCFLYGGVHPNHRGRGIGRELLVWQRTRAEQRFAASDKRLPAWTMASADARAPQSERLLRHAGFEAVRYFAGLERDLADPIELVDPSENVRIVPFTDALSGKALIARTDSFRDHWGSQPMSDEQWQAWLDGTFRADISFLAVVDGNADEGGEREGSAGEEVVGFVLCQVNEDDWETQGFSGAYIGMVGTTRAHRGRRIAPALLSRTLAACAAQGWQRVTLDVDSASPTGALGLYTRMGFVQTNSETSLVRVY
ncbi:GNAT family N-acetyltransferase [Diaminobutyricibacter sp. McL0608]|uniref:GNAT family N-acetyltransferase n=1 Tax=Leifsonia sp. McL0608 TaxID=3143537 RepID=UPI0031F3167B